MVLHNLFHADEHATMSVGGDARRAVAGEGCESNWESASENPVNWPEWKKWRTTLIACFV